MKLSFKAIYICLSILLVVCLLPLFAMLSATSFADYHNCTLHEGFVNPCVVHGMDWGDLLYGAFVSMWLFLLTGPVAALLLVLLAITAATHAIIRWRKTR